MTQSVSARRLPDSGQPGQQTHELPVESAMAFRCRETRRFLGAMFGSRGGRGVLLAHAVNASLLALLVFAACVFLLLGLLEGLMPRKRTLFIGYTALFTVLLLGPLATMPFFSFKDVIDRCTRTLIRRRLFVSLSRHVYYRRTLRGHVSLHLAKAHAVLGEKYRLLTRSDSPPEQIGRRLALSMGRSIRFAVRRSRTLISRGRLRPEGMIVGATYGYLFGGAKRKLRLQRCEPKTSTRLLQGLFLRYGALHGVFMYFIIHDRLPDTYELVFFIARVGDVVDGGGIT